MKKIILNIILFVSIVSFTIIIINILNSVKEKKIELDRLSQKDIVKELANKNLDDFISELDSCNLKEIENVREIPIFIKKYLDKLTGEFTIVDKNDDWEDGCIVVEIEKDTSYRRKERQLIYSASCEKIILLSYLKGGIGVSQRLIIIKHVNSVITGFWAGYIPKNTNNKETIIGYLKKNKKKILPLQAL